jgi:hypothetical protein
MGPQYYDEAAAALRDIIANPRINPSDRQQAADALARMGPRYYAEAATALRDVTGDWKNGARQGRPSGWIIKRMRDKL